MFGGQGAAAGSSNQRGVFQAAAHHSSTTLLWTPLPFCIILQLALPLFPSLREFRRPIDSHAAVSARRQALFPVSVEKALSLLGTRPFLPERCCVAVWVCINRSDNSRIDHGV